MTRLIFNMLWIFGLAFVAGCGDGQATVSGTVAFDGKPVPAGMVTFVGQGGDELVREGAVIQNGNFQALLPPGQYRVELNAQKVVGKRKQLGFDGKEEELEITEELFPARFNAKSELVEQIKAGGNTLKYDLKSAQ